MMNTRSDVLAFAEAHAHGREVFGIHFGSVVERVGSDLRVTWACTECGAEQVFTFPADRVWFRDADDRLIVEAERANGSRIYFALEDPGISGGSPA